MTFLHAIVYIKDVENGNDTIIKQKEVIFMTSTKTVSKKELFQKALEAIDKYNKAVEVNATIFQDLFDLIAKNFYAEIVANGWENEFNEFVLAGGEM